MMNIFCKMGPHPQKYMLKAVCKIIYLLCLGDCWYEESPKPWLIKKIKNIWNIFIHIYILAVLIDEYLAFFRADLSVKDKNDLIQMIVGLSVIYFKVIAFGIQKISIKYTLKRMLEDDRRIYSSLTIDRASVKKVMKYSGCLALFIIGSISSATVVGITDHLTKGVPFKTVVTYYPTSQSTGTFINILRFFIECHWWYFGAITISIDTLSYCTLIFIEHKFKVLQEYFKRIRKEIKYNMKGYSEDELANKMGKLLINGIKLHQNALWCATNGQFSLSNLYSLQIFQSTLLLVNTLIKLTTEEHSTPLILASISIILTVIFLCGTYMMTAGDVTWEADELCSAIYDCGWELTRGNQSRRIRTLVFVIMMRSQVPVIMTAFGIVPLSYANFVAVLRISYSFFAVLY